MVQSGNNVVWSSVVMVWRIKNVARKLDSGYRDTDHLIYSALVSHNSEWKMVGHVCPEE